MKTPFKFLDAYGAEDKGAFFGRDEEVAALYDMAAKNRLILVYGQSGTGKTSLVQCGLAGRFDATDWMPLFIRRQHDINDRLARALAELSELPADAPITDLLDDIYCTYLRPAYLIFDQLEELFVLGSSAEQRRFTDNINAILKCGTPCRILLIIREEYLAYLYDLEAHIPGLLDRRLRVEPMGRAKVKQVLTGAFGHYNMTPEAPEETTLEAIVDRVSGKSGVQLPFLQVWLDRFYRAIFTSQYPILPASEGLAWPALRVIRSEVDQFGDLADVLEDFLEETTAAVNADVAARFPTAEENAVRSLLDVFVSEEGTKRPLAFEWKGEALHFGHPWSEMLSALSPEALGFICRRLEQARLLRFSEDYTELAHDALAAHLHATRSVGQRRLQELYARVLSLYRNHQETGEWLSRRQLNSMEEHLPQLQLRLAPEIWGFVRQSQAEAEKIADAALQAEKDRRKRALKLAGRVSALAVIATVAAGIAFFQYKAAKKAQAEALRSALEARLQIARLQKVQGEYDLALKELNIAQRLATELPEEEKQEVDVLQTQWQAVKGHVGRGQEMSRREDLSSALAQYDSALVAAPDAYLEQLRTRTHEKLDQLFNDYMRKGQALLNARQYELARINFEKALQLKPKSEEAQQKTNQLRARN